MIAQDIQPVAPYTIESYSAKLNETDATETELLKFDAWALTFVAINALKELNEKVKKLEAENQKLRAEKGSLESKVSEIEAQQQSLASDLEAIKKMLSIEAKK